MRCLICGDDAWLISKIGDDIACDCRHCGLYRAEGGWFQERILSTPAEDFLAYLQLQREENPDLTPVISSEAAKSLFALSRISASQTI